MTARSALLLRAVNVSGRNRVPMAELRALLAERTTLTGISTYIASGNVICDTPDDDSAACAEVRALIAEAFDVAAIRLPQLAVRVWQGLVFATVDEPNAAAFDDVVALLGVASLLARRPHQLSGGEKQRVAHGRALLSQGNYGVLADG